MIRSVSVALLVLAGVTAGCSHMLPNAQNDPYALRDESGRPVPHTHVLPVPSFANTQSPFAAQPNVTYHGGPVQTNPAIYVVFWGYSSDPSGEAKALTAFLKAAGGSQWLGDVAQYYQNPGAKHIVNHGGQLRGTWFDSHPIPSRPSDGAVQAEAIRLAQHFNAFSTNAAFIVATGIGHSTPGFGKQFCSYHGATYFNGGYLSYTNLPYAAAGGPCTGAVSPPNYLSIAGHELAESQTDPVPPFGWFDSKGEEIADKCLNGHFQSIAFGSVNFYIQPLWSNAARNCVF